MVFNKNSSVLLFLWRSNSNYIYDLLILLFLFNNIFVDFHFIIIHFWYISTSICRGGGNRHIWAEHVKCIGCIEVDETGRVVGETCPKILLNKLRFTVIIYLWEEEGSLLGKSVWRQLYILYRCMSVGVFWYPHQTSTHYWWRFREFEDDALNVFTLPSHDMAGSVWEF